MRSNLMEKKVSQGAIQLHILRYLEQGRVNAYMSVSLQGFPERQLTADWTIALYGALSPLYISKKVCVC